MKETASVNSSFGTPMKTLHWATAVLVLIMLYGGFTMSRETATMHFGTGLVVLVAMVVWLAVRRASSRPAYTPMPRWQEIAAKATHHGLYATVTLQPIFGLLLVTTSKNEPVAYGVIPLKIARNDMLHEIGEWLHTVNAYAIVALVSLHILAVLYHQIILKDNLVKRMLPFAKV
ncbi:MAG: cytochrome b [Parvibaculum sp.]|nr:cytochrome b [Parvibaculum sp.]